MVVLLPVGTGRPPPRRSGDAVDEMRAPHSDFDWQPGVLEYGAWIGMACAVEHIMQAIAETFKARPQARARSGVMFPGREEDQAPVPWLRRGCALKRRVNVLVAVATTAKCSGFRFGDVHADTRVTNGQRRGAGKLLP